MLLFVHPTEPHAMLQSFPTKDCFVPNVRGANLCLFTQKELIWQSCIFLYKFGNLLCSTLSHLLHVKHSLMEDLPIAHVTL